MEVGLVYLRNRMKVAGAAVGVYSGQGTTYHCHVEVGPIDQVTAT